MSFVFFCDFLAESNINITSPKPKAIPNPEPNPCRPYPDVPSGTLTPRCQHGRTGGNCCAWVGKRRLVYERFKDLEFRA